MFWNKYPYTDMHELNLDWILAEIMKLHHDYDEFKAVNTITNAGAWDITKQYQAWTVVSDNNAGYISLKPVPAGVAISNTEYWGLIADYNILITNLAARIAALENDTAPVVAEYNLRTNRKILFVGDSYSGTSHWSYKTGDLFGLSAGVSYWVNAVGGEGFTIGQDGNGFLDELVQFHNNASVPDDEITDIIVCGGANDALDDTVDIVQGIEDFMDYATATFPNAKVYLGFIGAIINGGSEVSTRTQKLLMKACYMYSTIAKFGGHYLAGLEFTLHHNPSFLDAGGLHPTMTAGDALAKSIYNAVNGFNPINEWVEQTIVGSPLLGSDTAKNFNRRDYGETVQISCSGNSVDINPGTSTLFESSALGTAVYELSNIFFNRMHIVSGVMAAAIGAGSVFPVDVIFLDDRMYVRANNHSGASWDDITATRLILRNFTLTVPALDVM